MFQKCKCRHSVREKKFSFSCLNYSIYNYPLRSRNEYFSRWKSKACLRIGLCSEWCQSEVANIPLLYMFVGTWTTLRLRLTDRLLKWSSGCRTNFPPSSTLFPSWSTSLISTALKYSYWEQERNKKVVSREEFADKWNTLETAIHLHRTSRSLKCWLKELLM